MTTNNTAKIVTLLAVLIVSAIMSGCINSEATDLQTLISADIDTIDQKIELTPESTQELASKVTSIPKKRHIQITVSQGYDSLLVGVQGGNDYQQLKEIQVIVNNETLDIYTPEYQVQKSIECITVGEWKVVCRGIFEDGEIQTLLTTRFNGLPNSYVKTTVTPEQYDDPTPTVVATLAPTPAVIPTPEQKYKNLPPLQRLELTVWKMNAVNDYDSIILTYMNTPGDWASRTPHYIDWLQISVNGEVVDIFETTVNGMDEIAEFPMIIDLPNELNASDEITVIGYFSDSKVDEMKSVSDTIELGRVEEGEYNIPTAVQCPLGSHHIENMLEDIKN